MDSTSAARAAVSDLFRPRVGAVFSADIAVPEHEREVRFYSRVLSTGANALWREGDLMNNLGQPIIGLGARTAELEHLPLQWMPHIQVADVATSVARARELGGSVLLQSSERDARSQWAVLQDGNGSAFGIIPVAAIPAQTGLDAAGSEAAVGRIGWVDLTVPDAPATRDFYRQVIGWGVQDVAMSDQGHGYADYNMLAEDAVPSAGICHARGVNAGLPPVWMIYLPVGDLGDSLRRVEDEGGHVAKALQGKDGKYVYALIRDPVGAHFALTQG